MYDKPLLYDIAFSYRDYASEVACLLAWYARASAHARVHPATAIELAAGQADHAIELARRGVRAAALDLEPAMCEHAKERAAAAGVPLDVICGDMIALDIPGTYDLACTMISSLAHCYTSADLVRHLRNVAAKLTPRGVYVTEMPHPRDFLGGVPRVGEPWTCERDGLTVTAQVGFPGDRYEAIRQVNHATVRLDVRGPHGEERHEDKLPMREWTATEFAAAVAASGAFDLVEQHGDFAVDAPFDETPGSWRMISVLRKR